MPVAFEPFACDSLHRLDSPKFGRLRSPEMDRLYRHGSIIYQAPVEALSVRQFPNTGRGEREHRPWFGGAKPKVTQMRYRRAVRRSIRLCSTSFRWLVVH